MAKSYFPLSFDPRSTTSYLFVRQYCSMGELNVRDSRLYFESRREARHWKTV